MKCTDFWQKEKELKQIAIQELVAAVRAHNGMYEWDEDNLPDGIDIPIICVFLDNVGPTDVEIKSVICNEKGLCITGDATDGCCDIIIRDPYDIASAFHIQSITEAISETENFKDATLPQSAIVACLDREDLKMRGFDGSKLTNEELAQIAAKMGNYYLDYGFWDDMEEACNYYEVPRLNKEETEE